MAQSNLAISLPAELIEMVLSNFSLSDTIVAAAHLPQLWRDGVDNSAQIRKKLRALHYFDDSRSNGCIRPGLPFWFSSILEHGLLFVWHVIPNLDGIIFAPYSRRARLRILNPTTKVVERRRTSYVHGSESIVSFDLEGNLVCQRGINGNNADALWRYATKVLRLNGLEQGVAQNLTKRIRPG